MPNDSRLINAYCAANPAPPDARGRSSAMRREPMSAGWAWSPDAVTEKALKRGSRKVAKAKRRIRSILLGETTMAKRKTSTKKTPAKKTATKKAANGTGVPLKKLLPSGMKETKARRILRKAEMKSHEHRGRWEFSAAEAKKVKELLAA